MEEFKKCRILTSHLLNKPSRPLKLKEIVVERYQKFFISPNPDLEEDNKKNKRDRSESRGRSRSRKRSVKEEEEEDEEKGVVLPVNLLDEYEAMRKDLAVLVKNHNLTSGANLNPNHMVRITIMHLNMITKWDVILDKLKTHEVKTKKPLVVEWLPYTNNIYTLPTTNPYEWSNAPLQESIMLYNNLSRCLWVSSQFGNEILSRESYLERAFECLNKSQRFIKAWKAGDVPPSCTILSLRMEKHMIVLTSLAHTISKGESLLVEEVKGAGAKLKTFIALSSLHFTMYNQLNAMRGCLSEWKQKYGASDVDNDISELDQAKKQHIVRTYTNKVESLLHNSSYNGNDMLEKHLVASWHIMCNVSSRYLSSPSSLKTDVNQYIQRIEGLLKNSLSPGQSPPAKVVPQIDSVEIPEQIPEFSGSTRSIKPQDLRKSLDSIHKSLMI
jgi:hypothetical protein